MINFMKALDIYDKYKGRNVIATFEPGKFLHIVAGKLEIYDCYVSSFTFANASYEVLGPNGRNIIGRKLATLDMNSDGLVSICEKSTPAPKAKPEHELP